MQVHVLTAQARRYYRLEELLAPSASEGSERRRIERAAPRPHSYGAAAAADAGGDGGGGANPPGSPAASSREPRAPRVRLFRPEDVEGARLPDTLETARVSGLRYMMHGFGDGGRAMANAGGDMASAAGCLRGELRVGASPTWESDGDSGPVAVAGRSPCCVAPACPCGLRARHLPPAAPTGGDGFRPMSSLDAVGA
jgi:hypothetical protein